MGKNKFLKIEIAGMESRSFLIRFLRKGKLKWAVLDSKLYPAFGEIPKDSYFTINHVGTVEPLCEVCIKENERFFAFDPKMFICHGGE